jgi:DNA-binding HxlR family transcriptional regulator
MLVMGALSGGPMRFGQLRRRLDGVTQKMLTQTLRTLRRDGLVTRTVYPTTPPMVEYAAVGPGESVTALMHGIRAWSEQNINAVLNARGAYDARAGKEVQPVTERGVFRRRSA